MIAGYGLHAIINKIDDNTTHTVSTEGSFQTINGLHVVVATIIFEPRLATLLATGVLQHAH